MTMKEMVADELRNGQRVLPSLPGVNFKEGLERVAGNFETYLRLLREFPASQKSEIETIEQALAKKDFQTAKTCIHTIKGLAGNLSLTDVYQASVPLEMALIASEWNEADRLFDTFKTAFKEFSVAIDSMIMPPESCPAPKTMLLPRVLELLGEIRLKLLANSPLARVAVEELAAGFMLPDDCAEDFKNMQTAIGQFEFERALQMLTLIETKLKGDGIL
jgi:HPt (histidine-containing phosphotransfer) domain-containing protein